MIEQLKCVNDIGTVYGNRVKGSRRVTLVWKWHATNRFDKEVERDIIPRGESLRDFMSKTFTGDVLPVTGLPGKR